MKLNKNEVLVIKKVKEINNKLYSHNNTFQWKRKGTVTAPDWENTTECGHGLHGQLWNSGNFNIEDYGDTYLLLKVNIKKGFVNLGDKVKFKTCKVIMATKNIQEINKIIKEHMPKDNGLNYDMNTQGDYSTNTQGNNSTNTQGYKSTNTQGWDSTNTQGDYSTNRQRWDSTNTQGDYSTNRQGDNSTNTQGWNSTNRQGCYSTNTQGDYSTNTQGWNSTNTQGYYSTNTQGDYSTNTQGWNSTNIVYGTNCIYRNNSKLGTCTLYYNNKMVVIRAQKNTTLHIKNMKIQNKYTYTPEKITELKKHEIFIFGSNKNGKHNAGAALQAKEQFGAIQGQGEGLHGQSYAIPTLNKKMQRLTLQELRKNIENLIKVVNKNTTKIFYLTKIGCGIAKYKEETIKKLFQEHILPANLITPKGWRKEEN